MTSLRRVAPVFVTTDLARALAHYQRLGFVVEAYDGADYYGYACRDGIEIHFAKVGGIDCATTTSCAYLWVDDAAALHSEWSAAGVDGRLVAPTSRPTDSMRAPTSIWTATSSASALRHCRPERSGSAQQQGIEPRRQGPANGPDVRLLCA